MTLAIASNHLSQSLMAASLAHDELCTNAVRLRAARRPHAILLGEDARRRKIHGELLDASDGHTHRRRGPTGLRALTTAAKLCAPLPASLGLSGTGN